MDTKITGLDALNGTIIVPLWHRPEFCLFGFAPPPWDDFNQDYNWSIANGVTVQSYGNTAYDPVACAWLGTPSTTFSTTNFILGVRDVDLTSTPAQKAVAFDAKIAGSFHIRGLQVFACHRDYDPTKWDKTAAATGHGLSLFNGGSPLSNPVYDFPHQDGGVWMIHGHSDGDSCDMLPHSVPSIINIGNIKAELIDV